MNICLLSREYSPDTAWGGIGTYAYNLANGLAASGENIHVVCQSLDIDREYIDNDVHIHRVSHKSFFPFKGKLREFGLRWEYSQSVYNKLKEIIARHAIDIVEAPNLAGEGFIYSFHKKTPLVTRLHTHFSEVIEFLEWQKDLDRKLSCWFENVAIMRSDVVTCSTKAHAALVSREIGISPERVRIIPLGIPLPEINLDEPKENNRPPVVLYVGRLEKRKGTHSLIQAIPHVLKEIPEATFVIIGRDSFITRKSVAFHGEQGESYKEKLIAMLPAECCRNVHFLGYTSAEELDKYYRLCDVFVAPSLYESFGFIYVEAMSYAKPVIGCGVGGVPEVVEDRETGILIPPSDVQALAGAVIELLKNPSQAQAMGRRAREHVVTHFSRAAMVKNTLDIYLEILHEKEGQF